MEKRYKINNELRKFIKKNKKNLLNRNIKLKWTIKNLIYNNKSITLDQLHLIYSILGTKEKMFGLKEIRFEKEKNFGKYSIQKEVKFKGIDENFAEFVGILLGDGNLYRNSVRVMIDKREEQYKKYIKNLLEKIFCLHFKEYHKKGTNQLTLYIYSKKLADLLVKFGLKRGNKTKNKIKIPNWIVKNRNLFKHCLKGLIDTDGCVYMCKRDKKIYIKFTSTCPLLNDVKELAKGLNINFVNAGKNNICLYRKEQVSKYINMIGFSNQKHIKNAGLLGSLD